MENREKGSNSLSKVFRRLGSNIGRNASRKVVQRGTRWAIAHIRHRSCKAIFADILPALARPNCGRVIGSYYVEIDHYQSCTTMPPSSLHFELSHRALYCNTSTFALNAAVSLFALILHAHASHSRKRSPTSLPSQCSSPAASPAPSCAPDSY